MELQNTLASQAYALGRSAAAPDPESNGANAFFQSAAAFEKVLGTAEQAARGALIGETSPHALVQALSASEMAVDTVVTLRDKVVEAYQEILRMPV